MRTSNRLLAIVPSTLLAASLVSAAGSLSVQGRNGVPVEMPSRTRRSRSKSPRSSPGRRSSRSSSTRSKSPSRRSTRFRWAIVPPSTTSSSWWAIARSGARSRGARKRGDTYETARAAGYQAALLEQERPNIFTQSVANLEPGKTDHGPPPHRGDAALRARELPARVSAGGRAAVRPGRIRPAFRTPRGSSLRRSLPGTRSGHDVEIDGGDRRRGPADATSVRASHRIVTNRIGAASAAVRLADDDTIPNKDFQLSWSVASERPAVGFLAHRDGLDGFFTLLVQPKGEVDATEAMPKEITLVVDTSGSMSGLPIEASKRFIARALHELGPARHVQRDPLLRRQRGLLEEPLPNVRPEIERAIAWVNAAAGRRRDRDALRAADGVRASGRPEPPAGHRLFHRRLHRQRRRDPGSEIGAAPGDPRIYTVGIGSSVNRYLLDRMADLGRGAFITIRPDERTDDALESFRSWVTRPYLTDLTIDWGALPVADVSPELLRDLGSGQTLTLVGRYITGSAGDVVVRGKLGGRYWEQRVHVVLPDRQRTTRRARVALGPRPHRRAPAPFARTRIGRRARRGDGLGARVSIDEPVHVVRRGGRLARREPVRDLAPTIHQALPLPEGVSFEGIFGKAGPLGLQTDGEQDEDPEDYEDEPPGRAPGGVVGGVVGGVMGGVPGGVPTEAAERVVVMAAGAGANYGRAQGGYAHVTTFSSEFVSDLPVSGRFYQNVLALAPGVQGSDGDGNPTSTGARTRVQHGGRRYRRSTSMKSTTPPMRVNAYGTLRSASWRISPTTENCRRPKGYRRSPRFSPHNANRVRSPPTSRFTRSRLGRWSRPRATRGATHGSCRRRSRRSTTSRISRTRRGGRHDRAATRVRNPRDGRSSFSA